MKENVKDLLEENLLEKATGGNDQPVVSPYFDECFNAILKGNAIDAWFAYHDHFDEISPDDRDFLAFQYHDAFQKDINDDCPPEV